MTHPDAADFGNILDLDNYTDAASDALDSFVDVATSIADAHKIIGNLLKTIAPIVALYPGLGTAISVAMYAAGAAAAEDTLTDAIIGTAASALPPGLPRIAFQGGANITVAIADGGNILETSIDACRKVAATAGPQAAAGFDAGINAVRGGKIDARAIAQGREFAYTSGGQMAATSYDAGVSIASGNKGPKVLLDTARGYIRDMGGPMGIATFDTGLAMATGKTLQEAGYIGLRSYIKGNSAAEQVLNFIEKAGHAKSAGVMLETLLQDDMVGEFFDSVGNQGAKALSTVTNRIKPITDLINETPDILNYTAAEWAKEWHIEEAVIRTAQALMRNGALDEILLKKLYDFASAQKKHADLLAAVAPKEFLDTSGTTARSAMTLQSQMKQAAMEAATKTQEYLNMSNTGKVLGRVATLYPGLTAEAQAELNTLAYKGSGIAQNNAKVAAGRALMAEGQYRAGYDIGIGTGWGSSIPGGGYDRIRRMLQPSSGGTAPGLAGFDIGCALAWGITKQNTVDAVLGISSNPDTAMGQLAANGLVGSGLSGDQKQGIIGTVISNTDARNGVATVVEEKKGFFAKVLAFFGL